MRIALIAALCLIASPSLADLGEYCQRDIAAGNTAGVKRLSDMFLFSAMGLSPERAALAAECIKAATGNDYVYVPEIGKFELASEHDAKALERQQALADKAAQDRASQDAATLARKQAAVDAAKAEAEAAEAAAQTEKFLADVTQRQVETRAKVIDGLSEACIRQYGRDPDATIMNKMCFDVFMERGLPD